MPRAEKLSSRLDALIEEIFSSPSDPFALYWNIAAQLGRSQLAQVQTKIRKTLRQMGEIGTEPAVLLACVLHLTGFPAHRLLQFLSLYIPGGIRLSLFELALGAIFLGTPPIPGHLLYDLTQYTYLEKRLLVRKSLEISDALKGSLGPDVLLFLYLLSLRDDLSNETIQLVALIMKNCFPSQEVRTRLGGASLEEYGEIARAWKNAEQRSLDPEIGPGGGSARPFDRNSASFFLDKYFSDEALSRMRASAPPPPKRRVQPRPAASRAPAEPKSPEEPAAISRSTRLLFLAPTVCAAVLLGLLLTRMPSVGPGPGAIAPVLSPVPAPAPTVAPSDVAPPSAPVEPQPLPPVQVVPSAPETTSYVVRPGDSLWKIFTSMRAQTSDGKGWMDFLSTTQSMNSLGDPDRLQPGKVLTFSVKQ